jgi:hypothetical protein
MLLVFSLRSHCLWRASGNFLVFILWHSPKNEPRKRGKGLAPYNPARQSRAPQAASVASLSRSARRSAKARLETFVQLNFAFTA